MRTIAIALMLCVALTGCATNLLPDDYAGPTAVIKDHFVAASERKADFFFVSHIDGKFMRNTLSMTRSVNHGRGFYMEPIAYERRVPIKSLTLTIEGVTEYAAPILALFGDKTYDVSQEVTFHPQAGKTYVVKGVLAEGRSDVWIEDSAGRRVSKAVAK